MSSYICTPKHFNSIEASIKNLAYGSQFYFPYSFKTKFNALYEKRKATFDNMDACVENVVDELRRLNALCVSLQYKHHYVGKLDKEIEEQTNILLNFKTEKKILNKYELLAAMRCVNYQIETEHLKELRNLTESEEDALFFLKTMINELAMDIVTNLPEYEKAGWSID
mgnify:CR=1 FL=1